jgi:tRNA U34 5-methylaminomethyl-2-thiouridine-forming methyltransferase MnmC
MGRSGFPLAWSPIRFPPCRVQLRAGYKIVRLASGASSVHSLEYGETCHPAIGPAAEAEALYVRPLRLIERLRKGRTEFVIWDIGLGAAANSLAVIRAAKDLPRTLRMLSFDNTLGALDFALQHAEALGYLKGCEACLGELRQRHRICFREGKLSVQWELYLADFPRLLGQPRAQRLPKPHAILFDPFSPARNPAMWTLPMFTDLYRLLDPGRACALATYSRSTMLRVTLLLAGFFVGRGPGTGGKEETTIAGNRRDLISHPLDMLWLRRARDSSSAEPLGAPIYRQAPLSAATWEKLKQHPQFGPNGFLSRTGQKSI